MIRSAWFLFTCVLLGLATSVGVAWAGIFFEQPRNAVNKKWFAPEVLGESNVAGLLFDDDTSRLTTWVQFEKVSSRQWYYRYDDRINRVRYGILTGNAAFHRALRRHEAVMRSPLDYPVEFSLMYAGWPARCLAYEDACTPKECGSRVMDFDMQTNEIVPSRTEFAALGNIRPFYDALDVHGLKFPMYPLWPGLLANATFYGAGWAVVLGSPLVASYWLAQRRRRRQGLCDGCGYSRQGLNAHVACPECGRTPTPTAR